MKITYFIGLMLLSATFVSGQDIDRAKKADPVVWFGVDFSKAKFVRIAETEQQVKDVLNPINNLIPSEPKKYDISKYFDKQTVHTVLAPVQKRNTAIASSDLLATDPITLPSGDIQEVVSAYVGASDRAETGLLFVVENCDKSTQQISVYVCFFDIKTGELFCCRRAQGKAKGFGLRNYWAGGIYQIMKDWKY